MTMAKGTGLMLACGAAILAVGLGVRHGFGLFLQPMSLEYGWGREVFAFALAVQNLVWGAAQPFTGMLADRWGAGRTILVGALLYVLGLVLMAVSATPGALVVSAGVLIGLGLSGTTFSIVFGAVSRAMPPEKRTFAMGVTSAVGSFGQFAMLPGTLTLIDWLGWSAALLALGAVAALMVPLSGALLERNRAPTAQSEPLPIRQALSEASKVKGFWLLSFGYFVCGFHVVFIGIHLPSYLVDQGMPISVGTTVLALVGLFNIAGTYYAGLWGGRGKKPMLLAGIYAARGVAIAAFLLLPLSPWTAYGFGIAMGLLWLSTVPLTNGTVAAMFGAGNLSMLGGIVFFFHQAGAFLGGWLGGMVYDRTGSYDIVWLVGIALAVFAALVNLPIREEPVARLRPVPGGAE